MSSRISPYVPEYSQSPLCGHLCIQVTSARVCIQVTIRVNFKTRNSVSLIQSPLYSLIGSQWLINTVTSLIGSVDHPRDDLNSKGPLSSPCLSNISEMAFITYLPQIHSNKTKCQESSRKTNASTAGYE